MNLKTLISETHHHHVYISKFIALHGVLPLYAMSIDQVAELWKAFCHDDDQLAFSYAALRLCICDHADFYWKHNWREQKGLNEIKGSKIKSPIHPFDILNDWLEPMGLSFRNNGALCLVVDAWKNDWMGKNAAIYLTRDPIVALEFLGFNGNDVNLIKKHDPRALCSSLYFSPSVLEKRTCCKFSMQSTKMQNYALRMYPDIYEKLPATRDQLKQLTTVMKTRAFKHFPDSELRYNNVLAEINMYDTVNMSCCRKEIDLFEKQYESTVSFDLRHAIFERWETFLYLNGILPLFELAQDKRDAKWNLFRDELLKDNGFAPHDWIATRCR